MSGEALSSAAPSATLSASSRWLVGGAFAMAVLWKAVLSPDYLDGRFFRVMLETDERFADAALVFGGLSREQMASNREFLVPPPEGAELLTPPSFVEPPRLRAFAAATTWGGLILETLIAVTCLVPFGRFHLARDTLLLTFCVTTYALAPVAGFGWLIAAMGPGAVPPGPPRAPERLHRRVHPGAAVFRGPMGQRLGGLDRGMTGMRDAGLRNER